MMKNIMNVCTIETNLKEMSILPKKYIQLGYYITYCYYCDKKLVSTPLLEDHICKQCFSKMATHSTKLCIVCNNERLSNYDYVVCTGCYEREAMNGNTDTSCKSCKFETLLIAPCMECLSIFSKFKKCMACEKFSIPYNKHSYFCNDCILNIAGTTKEDVKKNEKGLFPYQSYYKE
jgi:hypothetical protein